MRKNFFLASLAGIALFVYSTQKTSPTYQQASMLESPQVCQTFLNSKPIETQVLKDFKYFINLENSKIQWQTELVPELSQPGRMNFESGSIFLSRENKITGGEFVIAMDKAQAKCNTEKSSESNLEKYLQSSDFLDVNKHPQMVFKIRTAKHLTKFNQFSESEEVMLTGELIIKGTSHPISFLADYKEVNRKIKIQGNFNIDGSKWGINPKSTTIANSFQNNNLNEIKISLQLEFSEGC
jgi:polyisoprenoid-binding protein YceI